MSLFEKCKYSLGGENSSGKSTYYDFNFQGRQGRLQKVGDDQVRITIKLPDNYLTTDYFSYGVGPDGGLQPENQGMSKGIIVELGRYGHVNMTDLFNQVDKTVKIAPIVRYLGQEGIMSQNDSGEPQFVAQRKFLPILGPAIMTVTNDQICYEYRPTDDVLNRRILDPRPLESVDLGMGDRINVKIGSPDYARKIMVTYTFDEKPSTSDLKEILDHEKRGRAIADYYAPAVKDLWGMVVEKGQYTLYDADNQAQPIHGQPICHFTKPEKLGEMQYIDFPHPKGREFAHSRATYQDQRLVFDTNSESGETLTVSASDMIYDRHITQDLRKLVEAVEHAVAQENGLLDFLDSHQATDYQPKTLLDLKDLDILSQGLEQ